MGKLRRSSRSPVTRVGQKIVRAPAKITGLIMFHLSCQIKKFVFWGIFGFLKNRKRPNGNPLMRVFIHDLFPMTHGHF